MRIGLSVLTHAGQSIWENGISQNVYFLAMLLRRIPFVTSLVLIDIGDQGAMPGLVDLQALDLTLMTPAQATDAVDVIIEIAGALPPEWLALMRRRGRKTVFFCCGNPYTSLAEPALFNRAGGTALHSERCDEIWYPRQYAAFAPMLQLQHRCEAVEMPYLWHTYFVDRRMVEAEAAGVRYGYAPRQASAGFRMAIFEPNLSVNKALAIPMLICDEASRRRPGAVQHMHVLNAIHMKDHLTLLHLANSLDIVREHRATFHGRNDVVGFMAQFADAVVAHQWHNEQNYNYLDVLHGDYPLVHNSSWLREAGYYYSQFDVQHGAASLLDALDRHDAQLPDYRRRSQRAMLRVSPLAQSNQDTFASRLLRLQGGRA